MMRDIIDVEDKTDEVIKDTFTNIYSSSSIYALKQLRDDILDISNGIRAINAPSWLKFNLEHITELFLDLFPGKNGPAVKVDVTEMYDALMKDAPSKYNALGEFYSIPFLKTFIDVQLLKKRTDYPENIDDTIKLAVRESVGIKDVQSTLDKIVEEGRLLNEQTKASLDTLNKHVGKIGVKMYADIFDRQALEHSNLFRSKGNEDGTDLGWGLGKAQLWSLFAILFIIVTILTFRYIEVIFPLNDTTDFTPKTVVNILGRIVVVSLGIFLISFAFKQFRINMHLYTLNKHRANTLKSFEYLTKAPDKLEPASYNAILMKVAESIYEAGQTGYVAVSESNNDMPSIIDMSKIITPNK